MENNSGKALPGSTLVVLLFLLVIVIWGGFFIYAINSPKLPVEEKVSTIPVVTTPRVIYQVNENCFIYEYNGSSNPVIAGVCKPGTETISVSIH